MKNVNRLAYDVTISSKDSILAVNASPDSSLVSKNGAKVSLLDTTNKKVIETAVTFTGKDIKPTVAKNQNEKNKIADSLTNYDAQQRKLQSVNTALLNKLAVKTTDYALMNKEMQAPLDTSKKSVDVNATEKFNLKKSIDSLNTLIAQNKDKINNIKVPIEAIKGFYKKEFELKTAYIQLQQGYELIWEIYTIKDKVSNIAADPFLNYQSFTAQYGSLLNKYRGNRFYDNGYIVKQYYLDLNNFSDIYNDLKDTSDLQLSLDSKTIARLMVRVDNLNSLVTSLSSKLQKRNPKDELIACQNLINYLFNPASYNVTSTPIQPTEDVVLFNIKIKNKAISKPPVEDSRGFTYSEYVRGGVRFDFSTGLVFSFGVGDYSYYKKSISTDSSIIVRNKRNNQYTPTIAAMFTTSLRTWRSAKLGFTLGASINTTTLDISSVFPGLSLMVGKRQQFIITIGPALQKVNFLQEQYLENTKYLSSTLPATIPTDKTFRVGSFIGVSYSLTKKQKDNFKLLN